MPRSHAHLARAGRSAAPLALAVAAAVATATASAAARADDASSGPTGAPPPEAKPLVEAPVASAEAPKVEPPKNETTASLSAGGQIATGNSQLIAGTANGAFSMRRASEGFGASLLANYGRG